MQQQRAMQQQQGYMYGWGGAGKTPSYDIFGVMRWTLSNSNLLELGTRLAASFEPFY